MAYTRTEKKLLALRRAEFRVKQRFEYIDWELDSLLPELESIKGKVVHIEPTLTGKQPELPEATPDA